MSSLAAGRRRFTFLQVLLQLDMTWENENFHRRVGSSAYFIKVMDCHKATSQIKTVEKQPSKQAVYICYLCLLVVEASAAPPPRPAPPHRPDVHYFIYFPNLSVINSILVHLKRGHAAVGEQLSCFFPSVKKK